MWNFYVQCTKKIHLFFIKLIDKLRMTIMYAINIIRASLKTVTDYAIFTISDTLSAKTNDSMTKRNFSCIVMCLFQKVIRLKYLIQVNKRFYI